MKGQLTPKQEAFAQCVAIEGTTQSEAYRRNYKCVGWTPQAISDNASRVASTRIVSDRIKKLSEEHRAKAVDRVGIDVFKLLETYICIAFVDPNELISLRAVCCRYCHGAGGLFQWREREFLAECDKAEAKKLPLPDIAGGFGYRKWAAPNPECEECEGTGETAIVPKDTTKLSPGALHLYRGVQYTKEGPKILFADKDGALQNIGRIIGAFNDRLLIDLKAKTSSLQLTTSDPIEAAKMYAQMIDGTFK